MAGSRQDAHRPPSILAQEEPFPLLLEPQSNAVAWSTAATSALSARQGDAAFQQAAAAALAEAGKVTPQSRQR